MINQKELDFTGDELKAGGIELAKDHANAASIKWSDRAFMKLIEFIKKHKRFKAEDFRSYCAEVDFDLPPHSRAFGGIVQRAAREYLIIKIGTIQVSNPKAHSCYSTLWEVNEERLMERGF